MYQEHPVFNPPPLNAILWRYMDFTKYISLLEKQALFFARADKFEDPFEGSYSKVNEAALPLLFQEVFKEQNLSEDQSKQWANNYGNIMKKVGQSVFINCWHENPYESAAMWKLYSREEDGIAIKTDFNSFKTSFTCSQSIYIGSINYVDYETFLIPEGNTFSPFLHKRKSFEHEREVRAINSQRPIQDDGAYYEVNLSLLIQKVIVAPFAPDWFFELVKSVTTRYNFNFEVVRSDQADKPAWG